MKNLFYAVILVMINSGVKAQVESHVRWSYAGKRINAREAVIYLKAVIDDKWHIYGLDDKNGGPISTAFAFMPSKFYTPLGKMIQPKPIARYEPGLKATITCFEHSVIFQQKIKLGSSAETIVKGQLKFMACNDHKCLPQESVNFNIPVI